VHVSTLPRAISVLEMIVSTLPVAVSKTETIVSTYRWPFPLWKCLSRFLRPAHNVASHSPKFAQASNHFRSGNFHRAHKATPGR